MSTTAPAAGERLSLPAVLTFSLSGLPVASLIVGLGIFLQPYIAIHLGVGLTMVGFAWGAVRLIDIPIDPVLGVMMDRTHTPLGRYRVWLIVGAPILMLGVYMMFNAQRGIGPAYLIGWLLVMYLGISILGLAQSAWGAVIAPNYHERSRVFGVLAMVGVVGMLLVLTIPALAGAGQAAADRAVPLMGWFVVIATPLCVAIVAWRTPEKVSRPVPGVGTRFNLGDYAGLATKPTMVRLLLAEFAIVLGTGWMTALYLFFFRDSRHFSQSQASVLLGVYILSGLVGAPTTAWVATRIGKHRTMMAATTAYSIGLCTVLMIPKGVVLGAVPTMLWCGFMASGFSLMTRAMIADVGDEVRLEQGKERISLIYALLGLTTKVSGAMASLIAYPLLDAVGYHAKEALKNSPEAVRHMEVVYLAGPTLLVLFGGACFIGWKLDEQQHGEIRAELDARDALYAEAPITESLTGQAAIPLVEPG
ncbi:MAG: MFS transporter [Caulobacterales bacterium]